MLPLCGPRYAHLAERHALRSGHVPSSLVMGGRRVKVERPRARGVDELPFRPAKLAGVEFARPLGERAFEQMVLGVSTRRYARSLEALLTSSRSVARAKARPTNASSSAPSAGSLN